MSSHQTKKLGEVCEVFKDGDWVETKNQSADGIRLVQTGNIGMGEFKDNPGRARYISEETFRNLNCTEVFPGNCLISRLPDPVGRACLIPSVENRLITAVDCTIIRFNDEVLPEYFIYYSQSEKYFSDVRRVCTGTTRKRVSRRNLSKIEIPLPPLTEQKRIVGELDEAFRRIDVARENAEKNLANAQELFESELINSFVNKNSESEFLGKVCEILDRLRKPVTKKHRISGPYPYYGATGIQDYVDNFIFDEALVLVGEDGADWSEGAQTAYQIYGKTWVNNHAHVLRPARDKVLDKFLVYYLNCADLNQYITGATVKKLNQEKLKNIKIPLPSIDEQKQIVKKLDALSERTKQLQENYQKKLEDLEEIKQSLLEEAFRGNI